MANGYFERGEMYDILYGEGLEGEITAHRPGIIISSDKGNATNPTVMMVYTTTTTGRALSVNHPFKMNGWNNYALCNQVATINKTRLKKFYGKLSDADMHGIDSCIQEAMGWSCIDETALKEKDSAIKDRDVLIEELKSEVAGVKTEIEKKDEEIAGLKMEIEMWQKCYGRCMDMLVNMKVSSDVQRRTEVMPPVKQEDPPAKQEEPEVPVEVETEKEERPDVNYCTITALTKIGCNANLARRIKENRPYNCVADLKRVPGMKATQYRILEPKVCCTPLKTVGFIKDAPDPGYEVESEDTVEVEPVVEPVAPVEPAAPVEQPEVQKVNINTASAEEIHKALGLSMTVCYSITGVRKREGLYKSVNDLLNVPRFAQSHMDRYGDMLEV